MGNLKVEGMTDGELAEIIEHDELVRAARAEAERRRAASNPDDKTIEFGTRSIRTTKAPCPSCGHTDSSIESKTMYDSPNLAHGGNVVGTAAYCGACRLWFDAATGERVGFGNGLYTY